METIKIVTPEQVKIYQDLYERAAKLRLDSEYIINSEANFIYDKGKLVCAYTLNDGQKAPFRYFSIFKKVDIIQKVLDSPERIDKNSFIEVAAIVMTPESPPMTRYKCYMKLMWHALQFAFEHKKERILGGSVIPEIQRMQYELMSHLLYKGTINQSLSIVNQAEGLVMLYYSSRMEFIFKAPYLICKKLFKYMIPRVKHHKTPTLTPA